MIGRSILRLGERTDGGPPELEVTVFRPERDAGQLAVGVGWEVHATNREGMAWLDLGPWKLSGSWLLSRHREMPFGLRSAGLALAQRCSAEGNWLLDRKRRAWYTAKVLACLLLGRDEDKAPEREPYADDYIEVAWLAGGHYAPPGEPTTYWGDVLRVGRGVRAGWWYEIGYVST